MACKKSESPKSKSGRLKKAGVKAGVVAAMIPVCVLPKYASAQIAVAISVSQDIGFGTVTENGTGGTVVVNTAGSRIVTGGVTAIGGAGLVSQGVVSVAGSLGVAIDLSVTLAPFTVSDGSGNTMTVDVFNLVTNGGGSNETVNLVASPSTFPLGATLNVGAGQVAGAYVGDFTVNANYQ